jgi:hypothetical protein
MRRRAIEIDGGTGGSASRRNQPASAISLGSGTSSPPPTGEEADHQRVREGPRLGALVADVVHPHADLLHDLAPHRGLEGLAWLDEAGQAGEHRQRELDAAGEERLLLAVGRGAVHERDDRRREAG